MVDEEVDGVPVVADKPKSKKAQTKPPGMWQVIFVNDDYTPMDFVVDVLMTHFSHTEITACAIMLEIHTKGRGVAGIYTRDIAETKANAVETIAQGLEHPLRVVIQQIED